MYADEENIADETWREAMNFEVITNQGLGEEYETNEVDEGFIGGFLGERKQEYQHKKNYDMPDAAIAYEPDFVLAHA